MIRWIIGSSLKLRFLVIAVAGGLMLFGIPKLSPVPVDVFPEFAPPRVEIQTPCLGLSAEEVEALVSVPLEQALNGVEVLEVMRQLSRDGMTMIVVTHEMNFARQVANRVIFMDHGSVVEEDTPDRIFSNPREARTQTFLKTILER